MRATYKTFAIPAVLCAHEECPVNDVLNNTIVLIPALNEAQGIGPTIKEIMKELGKVEIVVVDQNSKNGTAQIAANQGAKVIKQLGLGKGRAVAEGLLHVKKDEPKWLVMIDGDYTFFAKNIPQMINILTYRPDIGMISGRQYLPYVERYTLWKRLKWVYFNPHCIFHRILNAFHRLLNGVNMEGPLSGLRVIRYKCIKDFQPKSTAFDIEIEINCCIRKKGYKIAEIPVEVRHRMGIGKFQRFKDGLVVLRRMIIIALSLVQ